MSTDRRGERLNPSRSTHYYWHLICLRRGLQEVCDKFLSESRTGVLVDFGCGNMPYRPLFEPRVQEYIGCDLAGNQLADIKIKNISHLPQQTGTVSVVLSTQVLEHVENPAAYLFEAHRVLALGGYLVLTAPGAWKYHPDPTDFWRWTSEGLKKQITDAGFDVVHFKGLMGPGSTALQLWQDAARPRLHYRLRSLFTRGMQLAVQWADNICSESDRDKDACAYVVVAVKRGAK